MIEAVVPESGSNPETPSVIQNIIKGYQFPDQGVGEVLSHRS